MHWAIAFHWAIHLRGIYPTHLLTHIQINSQEMFTAEQ